MKIKKFTAASMQEAALLIRKELGNEAVILNSKKIKKRKWFGLINKPAVEVIAVLDQDFLENKTPQKAAEPKQTLKTPVSSPKIEERIYPLKFRRNMSPLIFQLINLYFLNRCEKQKSFCKKRGLKSQPRRAR